MSGPTFDLPVPERALALGAHPDDIEFGCGATLAKWAAHGSHVTLVVCTDGSKGTWDADDDLAALVATREREAASAAERLGAAEVRFLGLVDGELQSGLAERALVCREIRRARPAVVVGHDPWKRYRLHPDHRHAGWLLIDGIVAARDPHFFPEQMEGPEAVAPHRPHTALLFEADEPDHYEAVDPALDAKLAALLEHRSQWRSTMAIVDDATRAAFAARLRERAATAGAPVGLVAAEAFKRLGDL